MKYYNFFLLSFCTLGLSANAMSLSSSGEGVLSLQSLAMMQLAQEEDVAVLKKNLNSLPNHLALDLLFQVMNTNFNLNPWVKCELVADFRNREGVSSDFQKRLSVLEGKLLRGTSHDVIDENNFEDLDDENADELFLSGSEDLKKSR